MNTKRQQVILVNRSFIIREGCILAIQRAANDRHHASLWEVPGGKLDEGQDLHGTLEREVAEETGLAITPIDTIAHYTSRMITDRSEYHGMLYIALFAISRISGGALTLSKEHEAHLWCTYNDFLCLPLTDETRRAAAALRFRLKEFGVC